MVELAVEKEVESIEMYCHGELETDWNIHIHYTSDSNQVGRSHFGLRFVSLLKEFGFVHHSIWKEMQRCESPNGG